MPQHQPEAAIEIDAPIEKVWAVMLDTAAYGEWNDFLFELECAQPVVGEPIKLHVRWPSGKTSTSHERITVVEPPYLDNGVGKATLTYAYEGLPSKLGLVRSVRHQRLSQGPGEPTSYHTIGEFTGPLVRFAGPGRIEDGFRRHAESLKARVEELA